MSGGGIIGQGGRHGDGRRLEDFLIDGGLLRSVTAWHIVALEKAWHRIALEIYAPLYQVMPQKKTFHLSQMAR
jgi:hypothetical protein